MINTLRLTPNVQSLNFRYLKLVDLTGNRFKSPPLALEDGKAIEWLALDENPVGIIDEKNAFPTMKSLKELSLCCMHNLTTIGAKALSGLIALEILHVEGCPKLETIDEDALVTKVSYPFFCFVSLKFS